MEKEICRAVRASGVRRAQTGKSTLLRKLLPDAALWLDFSRPGARAEYLRNPDLLVQRCRALPKSRPARGGNSIEQEQTEATENF
jgi:hypothetical protein